VKVIHVNFSGTKGGAAIAASRLHYALKKQGCNSEVWCVREAGSDVSVHCVKNVAWQKLDSLKNIISQRLLRWLKIGDARSVNIFPSQLVYQLNGSDADIIHLHWVNAEMISIAQLARLKKPVVWTLHDMWPFCGAEHYTMDRRYVEGYRRTEGRGQGAEDSGQISKSGNEKLETGYLKGAKAETNSQTPMPNAKGPVPDPRFDLDRWVFRRKQKHWRDWKPHIVTCSHWLGDCARESVLFNDLFVQTIPNCLDLDLFKSMNQMACRKRFGLPTDKQLILFGAASPSDRRKGGDLLEAALKKLQLDGAELVVFGAAQGPQLAGLTTHWLGSFSEQEDLAQLYNAADLMCVPSRQDNLPNTIAEALSCGTPVVAFEIGGIPDMVDHKINGYLAKPFDTSDFAKGIGWIMGTERDSLPQKAREKAEQLFDPVRVAQCYNEVYSEALMRGH
jgi:glycosyltransferase involved in cell wall biosynthesis